jgi:HK97 family phage prohead protease
VITVIVGPPCAGKTTYVEEHMKAGDVRLDFDLLLKAVGGPDVNRYANGIAHAIAFACRESVFRNVTGALWRHSSAGSDAWMIHSAIDAQRLDAYQGAGASFLLIDPGEDTCIDRARARDGDNAERTVAAIHSWYVTPPRMPEGTETMKQQAAATRLRKITCKARLLDASPEDADMPGAFRALVSVFNVRDSQGGVLLPGAFKASLDARGGDPFPFMWSHRWDDLSAVLGSFMGEETDKGLVIDGQIDLDSPNGPQAYRLMKNGLIKEFSIGGFVPLDGFELRKDEDGNLTEYDSVFDLREVSLCLAGANPETQLLDVKAAPAVNGVDLDRLKALRAQIDALLAGEEPPGTDPSPEPPPPDGEDINKATEHTSGGLPNSGSVTAALLNAVVEAIGPKEK